MYTVRTLEANHALTRDFVVVRLFVIALIGCSTIHRVENCCPTGLLSCNSPQRAGNASDTRIVVMKENVLMWCAHDVIGSRFASAEAHLCHVGAEVP